MSPKVKALPPEERAIVPLNYTMIPYFAVETDSPKLSGIRGIGPTPLIALTNMRNEVRRKYPKGQFDLQEKITNPEFAGAWRMPEPE